MTEIEDMIDNTTGRQKEILQQLHYMNNQALQFMLQPGKTFKPKYDALQKTDLWANARLLIVEYFFNEGKYNCAHCKKPLVKSGLTMHHDPPYDTGNLFTPTHLKLLHSGCHGVVHMILNKRKKKAVKKHPSRQYRTSW